MIAGALRYRGTYDPCATYRRLRDDGVLGSHSYLHLSPGGAEIGWAPVDHLRIGADDFQPDWRDRLAALTGPGGEASRKAMGFIGFDAVDGAGGTAPDGSGGSVPLAEFMVPGERIAFTGDGNVTHHGAGAFDASPYLTVMVPPRPAAWRERALEPVAGSTRDAFTAGVRRAVESLHEGEVQKVVLSRFHAFDLAYDPIDLFSAYCESRTFSDAFLLCFGEVVAVVASPELLVGSDQRRITSNPLAGTRPRGATVGEDERLRHDLRYDHKEIVEHVLSVTTMLAQLEPVCEHDSLTVQRLMDISIHQNVQHLSSYILGRLSPERHVLDALWALFPGVTIAGFPKQRAVELLRSLESGPRGLYSGVIGWYTGEADCRFALAIRGVFRYGERTFLHAGAGIMAESVPEREFMETEQKLANARRALVAAVSRRAPQEERVYDLVA